jgi:hypothetical protein
MHLSPDGLWRWDGQQWVPNAAAPPQTAREVRAAKKAEVERLQEAERFAESPAGVAREAYRRGDAIFQFAIDLSKYQSKGILQRTAREAISDPNIELNAVAREGWRLVAADVVYIPGASTNLDAVGLGPASTARGTTIGNYVMVRADQHPGGVGERPYRPLQRGEPRTRVTGSEKPPSGPDSRRWSPGMSRA